MSRRELLTYPVIFAGGLSVCLVTWLFAFWLIGAHLDYRGNSISGFVALRLTPEAGLSYQWSSTGVSVWFWRPGENWRVWPPQ